MAEKGLEFLGGTPGAALVEETPNLRSRDALLRGGTVGGGRRTCWDDSALVTKKNGYLEKKSKQNIAETSICLPRWERSSRIRPEFFSWECSLLRRPQSSTDRPAAYCPASSRGAAGELALTTTPGCPENS